MEKRQITRQELVSGALKLGARRGTIRQWFCRGVPYRWQIRLMEYFEGPVEISDWAPEATVADWTFLDASYRRGGGLAADLCFRGPARRAARPCSGSRSAAKGATGQFCIVPG